MKHALFALAATFAATACGDAAAQQPPAPGSPTYYAAANCANCHGTDGRAISIIPPLAGRERADLEAALLEFKSGVRPATIMHQLAKGYSDDELKAFAAYFAAQQ
jgi:cytochrome c553